MVDASIIMVENIYHRFHQSRGRISRSPKVKETSRTRPRSRWDGPIAFATLIIIAVFLPLFLMGGIEGLLFRPLAITVAAAMLVALVLSLTLTPVLAPASCIPRKERGREGEVRFVKLDQARLRARSGVCACTTAGRSSASRSRC